MWVWSPVCKITHHSKALYENKTVILLIIPHQWPTSDKLPIIIMIVFSSKHSEHKVLIKAIPRVKTVIGLLELKAPPHYSGCEVVISLFSVQLKWPESCLEFVPPVRTTCSTRSFSEARLKSLAFIRAQNGNATNSSVLSLAAPFIFLSSPPSLDALPKIQCFAAPQLCF